MPQLLVIATHSGAVTNAIVCDTEEYAEELARLFSRCTLLQTKYIPLNNFTVAQYAPYIH